MQYELFYLVGASKEAELDKIKSEVASLITSEGGAFEEKQVVEKRKMAYDIKHENRGFYVAQRFELEDSAKIKAMIRKLNLNTNILRSLITKTDELPELTSRAEREAMAKKAEPRAEIKKVAPKAEPKAETVKETPVEAPEEPKTEEKKKIDEEDIDKKLEEILNI